MRPNNFYRLIKYLPRLWFGRRTGLISFLPINLTLNISYHCNSRCLTCNIWKRRVKEFTLEEWQTCFRKSGLSPFWLILSGGEPFLRPEVSELAISACRSLRPVVMNIPTNGLLHTLIPKKVEEILSKSRDTELVINFSFDGVGKEHDKIRNIPGNFEKLLLSYYQVKKLKKKFSNLTVGLHTVISQYNVKAIEKIADYALTLEPDQYITEIAEERGELDTRGMAITPPLAEYRQAVDKVVGKIRRYHSRRLGKITQSLRQEYYQLVKKILENKMQVIPCYAGWASAQISADGEVWPCCVRADSMGNLRDYDYDFKKVWLSQKSRIIRTSIKNKECYCPLASAAYTNMMFHLPTIAKIFIRIIKNDFSI